MSVFISELRFEHHRENLGVGEAKPRLSWKFSGSVLDWIQESYEIEIERPYALETRKQTYTVKSAESVLVPWPCDPLQSGEAAAVRVRSFGNGAQTPWSDVGQVEAGLLKPEDWTCSLIETSHVIDPNKSHSPTLFRRSFFVSQNLSRARLYITAHGIYEVEINGIKASDHVLAPGWTVYNREVTYQTLDVSELLRPDSENVVGVHVAEGWYCGRIGFEGGRHNIWGSRLGVIAQMAIFYDDNTRQNIGSDSLWSYHSSHILSASLYDGETCDLSLAQPKWSSATFDASAWNGVAALPNDARRLRAPDGPPIRATEKLPAISVTKSPSGKTIVDFGQNLVGCVRLKIPRGPPLHKITMVHTEVLENGECATRPLRLAKATDTLILPQDVSEDETYWQPRFTFHGFRYMELNNWPQDFIDPADFSAVVIHTDMKRTATFKCSNPLLNRLHENVVWSMRGNFVGVPTDCPQRDERLGWTGDIQAFAPTATFLYDCQGMLKSWLRNLAVEQKAGGNGALPFFSPNVMQIPTIPVAIWGDAAIFVPWDMYLASGDKSILSLQKDSMLDWIDKGIPRNEQGLWGPTLVQLGDWLDPIAPPDRPGHGSTDAELVANAFLIKITDLMSAIFEALDETAKASSYAAQATALRAAFAAEYVTTTGRLVSDSQTALALAIYFSLLPSPEQEKHAAMRLEQLIRVRSRFKIATGFAGTPILGHALSKVGKSELFYRMLMNTKAPSWLYPVTMGATTIWERWDSMLADGRINPGEMTSFNHYALGAVADWIHTRIGGIQALTPGWKKFRIAPVPGGRLECASITFESPYGTVKSEWMVKAQNLILQVQVPPNTTAEVILPGQLEVKLIGSGLHEFSTVYVEPERPTLPKPLPFTTEDDDPNSLT